MLVPSLSDTIAAIATAPGRGAVALLRLSGPDAFAVAGRVLSPWPLEARRATLCSVRDPADDALLDRALVTTFPGPRSYTGEDVVEIATHGGHVVPASVLAALVAAGARPALAGEFTRRAVLAGRMDLVQAEAVGDLVDARSGAMQRAALRQLDGGLSRRVNELREALLEVEALLAYDIDFPEEDDGPIAPERVTAAARGVLTRLDALIATAPAGTLVRDGAAVVIAGAPNAGKSSLFNALLGERRAIVTEVPGTTRDAIEAVLDARPFPLRLVDTAGLRRTEDVVERLGIEVSEEWLARAEVVLACGETAADVAMAVERARALTAAPVLGVWTKRDGGRDGTAVARGAPPAENLAPDAPIGATGPAPIASDHRASDHRESDRRESDSRDPDRRGTALHVVDRTDPLRTDPPRAPTNPDAPFEVSAHTGAGLAALLDAVQRTLGEHHAVPTAGDLPLVTRARHRRALDEARDEVALFLDAWTTGALPAPVAAVHVRAAAGALESLIGAVDVEEVLGKLFGEFCVGK